MKLSLLFCVVLSVVLSILFVEVTSQSVSCGRIRTYNGGYGELKTCFMKTTTINSDGFVISSAVDSSVEAINFYNNKKIHFLPIRIGVTFPNIVDYDATGCSIKTVSKKNFGNLKKLKYIALSRNQIERINSDTFADLKSLEELLLIDNKIKQINGAAFRGLSKLRHVYLQRNVCISKGYPTPTAISTLAREVTEKCGFPEVEETTENNSNAVQSLNVSMEKLMKENKECLASKLETNATMSADILALKSQLKISEDAKSAQQAENEGLKLQLKAAKSAHQVEIDALKATVQMKMEEISGLLDEQATNRATINEKKAENALLRKTLETKNFN